jgi:hypothetical protein
VRQCHLKGSESSAPSPEGQAIASNCGTHSVLPPPERDETRRARSERVGVGVKFGENRPPPDSFATLRRSTSPFQGEVTIEAHRRPAINLNHGGR